MKIIFFDLVGVLFSYNKRGESFLLEENIKIIEKLKENYSLVILSNASREQINFLKKREVYEFFSEVIFSSDVGFKKPEKEFFEIALTKLNVRPEDTVFIDDSKENIEVASALGIKGIYYRNSTQLKESLRVVGVEV